jgi:glycosyltransferase involved in cell wall biosynthesis
VLDIPNGFDRDDFSGPLDRRTDGAFRIVHAGFLHTESLGGGRAGALLRRISGSRAAGVDVVTRSHVFLLEAIKRILAGEYGEVPRLELHLAGALSPTDLEIATASPVVRPLGYLPHAEVTMLLRTADLLFLPMHELPAARRATIVPGKTYEYLASGTPILAAVPDGDARDLLERSGAALICRPRDVDCMARAIVAQAERARRGDLPQRATPGVIDAYERRQLTRRLADVFDAVLGQPGRRG